MLLLCPLAFAAYFFGFGYLASLGWRRRLYRPTPGECFLNFWLSQAIAVFSLYFGHPAQVQAMEAWVYPLGGSLLLLIAGLILGRGQLIMPRFPALDSLNEAPWYIWLSAAAFGARTLYPWRLTLFPPDFRHVVVFYTPQPDFVWHCALMSAIRLSGVPPIHPYFPGDRVNYHLFYHVAAAGLTSATMALHTGQVYAILEGVLGFLLCVTFYGVARLFISSSLAIWFGMVVLAIGNGGDILMNQTYTSEKDPLVMATVALCHVFDRLRSWSGASGDQDRGAAGKAAVEALLHHQNYFHIDHWPLAQFHASLHIQEVYSAINWSPHHVYGGTLGFLLLGLCARRPSPGWVAGPVVGLLSGLALGASVFAGSYAFAVGGVVYLAETVGGILKREKQNRRWVRDLVLQPVPFGFLGGIALVYSYLHSLSRRSDLSFSFARVNKPIPPIHNILLYITGLFPMEFGWLGLMALLGAGYAYRKRAWPVLQFGLEAGVPLVALGLTVRAGVFNDLSMRGLFLFQGVLGVLCAAAAAYFPGKGFAQKAIAVLVFAIGVKVGYDGITYEALSYPKIQHTRPDMGDMIRFIRDELPIHAVIASDGSHENFAYWIPPLTDHQSSDPEYHAIHVADQEAVASRQKAFDRMRASGVTPEEMGRLLGEMGADYWLVSEPEPGKMWPWIGRFTPAFQSGDYALYSRAELRVGGD